MALLPSLHAEPSIDAEMEVGKVNGATIVAREFVEAMRRYRHLDVSDVEQRRLAREDCVSFKIIELFACELEMLPKPSDRALRDAFARENVRRASALSREQVIYGPRQLTWEQFRATWRDKVERDYGRQLLASQSTERQRGMDEYTVFAAAIRRRRQQSAVIFSEAALSGFDANTVFDLISK